MLDQLLARNVLPDFAIRAGIRHLLKKRLEEENRGGLEQDQDWLMRIVGELRQAPIAIETKAANEQHYEVPTPFYKYALGKNLKYSSCYYPTGKESLNEAEDIMLALTCKRAELKDGMDILELGCGWGSLSMWMAKTYPNAKITGVSNSRTQKEYIDAEAARRGLKNLTIITKDMNEFTIEQEFDRIVSVEMFEHMRNYQNLLQKVAGFLKEDGRLFIHIFTHRDYAYYFDVKDESDWMSKYFFTGGIMPSDHLLLYFQDHLRIENHWRVNGQHYEKTSNHWLDNMDAHKKEIMPLFAETYGAENATKWWAYWRIFFMACAELWGFREGKEWFVSHYLFSKRK